MVAVFGARVNVRRCEMSYTVAQNGMPEAAMWHHWGILKTMPVSYSTPHITDHRRERDHKRSSLVSPYSKHLLIGCWHSNRKELSQIKVATTEMLLYTKERLLYMKERLLNMLPRKNQVMVRACNQHARTDLSYITPKPFRKSTVGHEGLQARLPGSH